MNILKLEWKELLGIFNSISIKVNIPEIDWIKDLNQTLCLVFLEEIIEQ